MAGFSSGIAFDLDGAELANPSGGIDQEANRRPDALSRKPVPVRDSLQRDDDARGRSWARSELT